MDMGKWHSMCQKISRMIGNYILHFDLQKQGINTELLEYLYKNNFFKISLYLTIVELKPHVFR